MKYLGLLGLSIIGMFMFMIVVRVPYFLIKYLRVHCKVSQELRKSLTQEKDALQHLRSDKRGKQKQNAAVDAKIRLLSFKESMLFWPKEFKIIFFLCFFYVVLQSFLNLAKWKWWENDVSSFIMLLLGIAWCCVIILSPIIAVLFVKLSRKLRKTLQQLEEAIVQRDKALAMQDTIGGKDER